MFLQRSCSLRSCVVLPARTRFSVAPSRLSARLLSNQSAPPNGTGKEKPSSEEPIAHTEQDVAGKENKSRSRHAQWYSDFVPGMIPIALLGSAVYIGLQLVQTKLSTEKYLDEANARIAQLEEEIKRLQSEQELALRDRASSGSSSSTDPKRSRWWWLA